MLIQLIYVLTLQYKSISKMSYPRFYLRTSKTFREDATVHYSMSLSRTEKIQSKTKIKLDSRYFKPHIVDEERKFIDKAVAKRLGSLKIAEAHEKKLQEIGKKLVEKWNSISGKDEYANRLSVMKHEAEIITGLKKAKYRDNKKKDLFEVFDEYINRQLKGKTDATVRAYEYLKRRLKAFENYHGQTLGFADINDDFWEDFLEFSLSDQMYKDELYKKLSPNSLYILHRRFVALMNFAVARKHTDNTLFKLFKTEKVQVSKIYLKPYDIELIERVELSDKHSLIRDIFLMCCYTGARVGDVLKFTKDKNIEQTVSGRPFIYWEQQKTGEIVSQEITDEIAAILKRYDGFPNENNKVKYQSLSKQLKEIVKASGVEQWEKVTSHTGRRSKATNDRLIYNKSWEDIRKLLGHASIEQTRDYFKASPSDVLAQIKLEA